MTGLFRDAGISDVTTALYELDVDLEELLAASSPEPVAADRVRRIFADDLGRDRLGVGARVQDGRLRFAFPTAIVVGRKPG